MCLLTQGNLFFLDLALDARTSDRRVSLSSVVRKWVDGVAAVANDSADDVDTASSTLYEPPPTHSSATIGLTSPMSTSSGSTPQNAPVISNSTCPGEDPLADFASSHVYDDDAPTSETSVGTSGMVVSPPCDSGSDLCDSGSPSSQQHQDSPRGVKRKIGDTDIVPESDGNDDTDLEEPILGDPPTGTKYGRTHASSTTYIGVNSSPHKRVKREGQSVPLLSTSPDPLPGCIPTACTAQPQGRPVDNGGYIIGTIKKCSEYTTKDLPVPCDRRWSRSFISTAILWYSVQNNIWNVPQSELTSALQRIFNVVYPDVKYRVTPAGPVYTLALQRIHAWRASFSSSALAMLHHFFASLDARDVPAATSFLATDFRFLRADPDACAPTELFRSPFLLVLLAIAHLGDVVACVDVPGWDTRAMVVGEGGEGVVGIASAALEHALSSFCNLTTVADQREHRHHPVILDVHARRHVPDPPDLGSAMSGLADNCNCDCGHDWNWAQRTAVYRAAVSNRGRAFVRETFEAAWAKRQRIIGNDRDEGASGDGDGKGDEECIVVVDDSRDEDGESQGGNETEASGQDPGPGMSL